MRHRHADSKDLPTSENPVATATPNERGEFELPQLAADSYALQLLSTEGSGAPVVVSLSSVLPNDVFFPAGPSVHGRLLRTSGSGGTPGSIEIGPVQDARAAARGDLVDRTRFAKADENGAFRVVLGIAGTYRLHATWGTASADRDFAIDGRDVDLGEIPLVSGTTLRGSIGGHPLT